jgi:hypothetical protein
MREHLALLYLQHQCMTYSPPPDRVTIEFDRQKFDELIRLGDGHRLSAAFEPQYVWYDSKLWREFPLARWQPGPAYFHRMKSPRGNIRLVGVDIIPQRRGELYFWVRIIKPATLLSKPALVPRFAAGNYRVQRASDSFRLLAGQSDPHDAGHFTIEVIEDNRHGIIDGWLQDNDFVLMEPREKFFGASWTPFENIGSFSYGRYNASITSPLPNTTPASAARKADARDPLVPIDAR